MKRLMLIALVTATAAAAETPEEIATLLSRGHPEVAALIAAHPEMKRAWTEDFWADALLRAPKLPGSGWRIHDFSRPQPNIVTPAMNECAGARAPRRAVTLFDGRSAAAFTGDKLALWHVADGALTATAHENNRIATRAAFGNMHLHLEFRTPSPPRGVWQYRGNSGVFLMRQYEVQILDSYNNPTYPDGQMGALYGQVPPRVNASLPPGRWQCLDIYFRAPRFAGRKLQAPARATIRHNGVLVQRDATFLGPTAFAAIKPYMPHAAKLPFTLQDHGDGTSMVSFRNIWVLPL
jgi:hypothetical protein